MIRGAHYLLLATGLAAASPAIAQGGKLDQELSILADRFFLRFPKEAKNEPRSVDIMSAPPGEEEETRIVMDNGEEKLVFFAQEMEMLGTPELASAWKGAIEEEGADAFEVKSVTTKAALEVVSYTPRAIDATRDAILLSGLLVRCADGMLLNLQAYINTKANEHVDAYRDLVTRVFASLRQGSRVVDLSARTVKYPFGGSKEQQLVIDLPKDHVITTDSAYDFFVYRIRRAPVLGEEKHATITLYLGDHPSLFMTEMGRTEEQAERVPGTLFGKPMEWLIVDDEAQHAHIKEQIVPMGKDGGEQVAHVAVVGNDVEAVASLVQVAERFRIEP